MTFLLRRLTVAVAVVLLAAACDTGVDPTAETEDTTPTVQFATSAATFTEGDGVATVDVTLTNAASAAISVDVLYGQAASTTTPSDLGLPGGGDVSGFVVETLTFPANAEDGTTRTLTFELTDDESGEPREVAFFALQNLVSGGPVQMGENNAFRLEIGFPTLQEIRDQNEGGDLVAFQAVVSRAQGNFTYVQDESLAGMTIRQASGEFQSLVADGTIRPGTRLLVSGSISYFAGLTQINGEDLSNFEILGQGEPPEPQRVTLADVEGEAGEAYEAELIEIVDMTFSGTGSFSTGTNYDVEDGTGSLVARVPDPGDTELAGESVPSSPVTYRGVVGQFHGFDFVEEPDGGYQLLLISDDDLQ